MELTRIWNPPNPYLTEERELLGEAPVAELEIYEDQSKSILSRNDSPDLGFRWSVNPYRGCFHACAYCIEGDTLILMGDGSAKRLRDIRVGDAVYGTVVSGDYRRYIKTSVLAIWSTEKPAYRITFADDTQLLASADHRFLTRRGWKYVTGTQNGRARRPHLTVNDTLMGLGKFGVSCEQNEQYKQGYLCGIIRGDALLGEWRYQRAGRIHGNQYQFRLALKDPEPLLRTQQYLLEIDIATHNFIFSKAINHRSRMAGIRTHAFNHVRRIKQVITWPDTPSTEWNKGFLAGIFDAEGSYSTGVLRICNTDETILQQVGRCLSELQFDWILEPGSAIKRASNIRIRGGLQEHVRFFHMVNPCIVRKRNLEGKALKNKAKLKIVSIGPTGLSVPMFDMTTGTGDFIANGVVSHNCYARPTHEYFGLGAGTDFERRIFVKPNAPHLLEAAFRKPSWKGERIMFSGVTDCYQPLEAAWKLTQGCLQVCLKYRNPVGIVTKSLLIRRDAALLAALAREADASVSMSIPFFDERVARIIEPGAPTIKRRFETMRILADAGVPVGIGVAPIIPGLNDADIPSLLKEAKRCGAQCAFRTLLRLPGSVKAVFFHRLEQELPLAARKIEHRIRETREGKLSDSRFGHWHHGEGEYWKLIDRSWDVWTRRIGFNQHEEDEEGPAVSTFRRPQEPKAQLEFTL